MKELSKIWMHGKFVDWKDAKIHVLTHGLHYGTAIFEGMRCYDTPNGPAIFRMDDHFSRFFQGVKSYQFEVKYTKEQLKGVTRELIRKNKVRSCYIRPIGYVGYSSIGITTVDKPFDVSIIPVDMGEVFRPEGRARHLVLRIQLEEDKREHTLAACQGERELHELGPGKARGDEFRI